MSSYFQNKVVWIVGASSGIGRELALQVAQKGAKVIVSSRNEESLKTLKNEMQHSERHIVFPLDLENLDNLGQELKDVVDQSGTIDILFNNGGVSQRGEAMETSMEVNRRIMEINYFGNIQIANAAVPYMVKNGGGHVVVMSSIAGKFGFFLRSAYSAAKHALHGYYESLRLELEQKNIQVTIVCPGKINTEISTNALNASGEKHGEMDHNQATGMSVELCVKKMLDAVEKQKKEVLIGNKEILAVYIKRFFPALFYKIIRKQSAT